jgi:hypothetical protein
MERVRLDDTRASGASNGFESIAALHERKLDGIATTGRGIFRGVQDDC